MRPEIERLSPADRASLLNDEFGWPPHIGVVGTLDGSGLVDDAGRFQLEAVRDWIEARLPRVPRLRQVLVDPPFGLGGPYWWDAPAFDIAEHVAVHPLAQPAGETELLARHEEFRRLELDRGRPLWRLWLLPGLPGGRVGVFVKLHHAVADGVAGIDLLGHLLASEPDERSPASRWSTHAMPSRGQLLADSVRRSGRIVRAWRPANLPRPRSWVRLRAMFARRPGTVSSLTAPIGPRRRIAVVRGSLAPVRDAAHRYGGTVNDAVLAAVAGGLGDLLVSRGEEVTGRVLYSFVPMSLRPGAGPPARGNHHGPMVLPLPIGEPDLGHRLRFVAAESTRHKREPRPHWGDGLTGLRFVQRLGLRYAKRQRRVSVYVADLRGPAMPLYLAGAEVLELFPVVPLSGNLPLGLGVLSYRGQLNLTAVVDPDAVPDLDVFVASLSRSLATFGSEVLASAVSADGVGGAQVV